MCIRDSKIANPTILARIPHEELEWLLRGYGWDPHFVEGDDPHLMHQTMAATLEPVSYTHLDVYKRQNLFS